MTVHRDAPPIASVVIAAFNAEATIGDTLQSVLAQTHDDLEVVVVDDGSVDDTAGIVIAQASRDRRVAYHRQDNAGLAAARNAGLALARGRYFAVVDADDLWHPRKLAKQIDIAREPDVVVLTGMRRFTVQQGRTSWLTTTLPPATGAHDRYDPQVVLSLSSFQMAIMTTALMHTDLARRLGGWSTKMWTAEDWEFWIRASHVARFKVIDEPLLYYRKHAASMTQSQDLLRVLHAHEGVIRAEHEAGRIGKGVRDDVLLRRRMEICSLLIHQRDSGKARTVIRRSLRSPNGWRSRAVWTRVAEVARLEARRLARRD